MISYKSPNILSDILIQALKEFPNSQESLNIVLDLSWKKVVGPIISPHSQVERLDSGGVLIVLVDNKEWIKPLNALKKTILERLKYQFGFSIKSLSVKTMPNRKQNSTPSVIKPITRNPPSEYLQEAITKESQLIMNPDLRDAFLRAFNSYPFIKVE
jgi:hypothetical protein